MQKYSKNAQSKVKGVIDCLFDQFVTEEHKKGSSKSGRSGKKQAAGTGSSEARKRGSKNKPAKKN